jgi:5-hydroxyisourate hydrolase
MNGVTVSTHVLHLGTGRPAAGLRVRLDPGGLTGETDAEGRLRFDAELAPGTYTLRFELASASDLYRSVALEVRLDEARHHHLPLLVSPFGVSAYRGT